MEVPYILEVPAQMKDFMKDMAQFYMMGDLLRNEGFDKNPGVPEYYDLVHSFGSSDF